MLDTIRRLLAGICLAGLFGTPTTAQERPIVSQQGSAYELSRETVLQGTVLNYIATSTSPPLGAHVILQTTAGPTDIHLGTDEFLRGNNIVLAPGDTVQIVGSNISNRYGTMFIARVIQKGGQSLAVRTTKGMPLWTAGARTQAAAGRRQEGGGAR
jgi:hypothetical protein